MPIQSPTSKDLARKSIVELAQITYNNALAAQEAADELAPLKGIDADAVAADAAIAEAAAASARGYSQTAAVYADNASADADNAAESAGAAAASASAAASNATAARGASSTATAAAVRAEAAADRAEAAAGQGGGGASWYRVTANDSYASVDVGYGRYLCFALAESPTGGAFETTCIFPIDTLASTTFQPPSGMYGNGIFNVTVNDGGIFVDHTLDGDPSDWRVTLYYQEVVSQ